MLSAQTNYHLTGKDSATAEFVNNMLQNEANNYLSNMNTLSHVSKMCSSFSAHWPPVGMPNSTHPLNHHHHHHLNHHNHQIAHLTQSAASSSNQIAHNAAAAAAAAASLAAGHNIESILGGSYGGKIDNEKMANSTAMSKHEANTLKNSDFNNSYDAGKNFSLSAKSK
jgi:hypothetical protein